MTPYKGRQSAKERSLDSPTWRSRADLPGVGVYVAPRAVVVELRVVRVRLNMPAMIGARLRCVGTDVVAAWVGARAISLSPAQTRLHSAVLR